MIYFRTTKYEISFFYFKKQNLERVIFSKKYKSKNYGIKKYVRR